MKTTGIINIGDELLIGQVVNTNASWMAEQLNRRNIAVSEILVIADSKSAIENALDRTLASNDVVLITGGLGPTKDDITKTVLCNYFNDRLVVHQPTLENVRNYFAHRGLEFTELNKAQALVPEKSKVILNKVGTAPCMMFETDGKIIVSMPGVPFEMKWLMTNEVLPILERHFGTDAIVHKTVLTFGIGESFLADKIEPWETALPEHIHLAYLPEAGKVRLRLSAYGKDHRQLETEVAAQIERLEAIIGDNIYGYDDDTIVTAIGNRLRYAGKTISTAESCTGGTIASKIVKQAGASDFFRGGIVSYTNDVKIDELGVDAGIIAGYGVVSEQTAVEMAQKCRLKFKTDYAIATTGVSGPTGGTETTPRGTVFIAVASPEGVECHHYVFETLRDQHIERASNQALFDFWSFINNK